MEKDRLFWIEKGGRSDLSNKDFHWLISGIKEISNENQRLLSVLREIDTHIRADKYPVPYIVELLKRTLPEYQ